MKGRDGEQGATLVMFAMLIVILVLFAAMVIDVGFLLVEKGKTQNALDAAALAGAQELPGNASDAEDRAREYALENGLDEDEFTISFECTSKLVVACNAAAGKYDTIVLSGTSKAPVFFGAVLGLVGDAGCWADGCNVSAEAAACSGGCGSAVTEVDIVTVIDHTGSMNNTELQNAKDGAGAMYKVFDQQVHSVALAVTPPVHPNNFCDTIEDWSQPMTWLPVPLSNSYQTAPGQLNTSSSLVATTNCLDLAGNGDVSGPHTNLGEPMKAAMNELLSNGRPNATKGVVFMTDGAANIVDANSAAAVGALGPCDYAMKMANQAKANGIEIYTIAYGADDTCNRDSAASPWRNKPATALLSAMATDAAHFYNQPKSADLDPVFQAIGIQLGGSTKLIR